MANNISNTLVPTTAMSALFATPGGAGSAVLAETKYYKMVGNDDGAPTGFTVWVVKHNPDLEGLFANPVGNLTNIYIANVWFVEE